MILNFDFYVVLWYYGSSQLSFVLGFFFRASARVSCIPWRFGVAVLDWVS